MKFHSLCGFELLLLMIWFYHVLCMMYVVQIEPASVHLFNIFTKSWPNNIELNWSLWIQNNIKYSSRIHESTVHLMNKRPIRNMFAFKLITKSIAIMCVCAVCTVNYLHFANCKISPALQPHHFLLRSLNLDSIQFPFDQKIAFKIHTFQIKASTIQHCVSAYML